MTDPTPKSISITPALTSLIKPTTDMLGEELRDYIREKISGYKEKKKTENLSKHLLVAGQKVSAKSTDQNINISEFELFEDWTESVQDVDPENEDIASMWQNLLVELSNKQPNVRLLMQKLKELDPEDAVVLIKLEKGPRQRLTQEERYRLDKLKKLDLIEENTIVVQSLQFGLMIFLVFVLAGPFLFLDQETISSVFKSTKFYAAVLFLGPASIYLFLVVGVFKRARRKGILAHYNSKLTWIGKRITSLGDEYPQH